MVIIVMVIIEYIWVQTRYNERNNVVVILDKDYMSFCPKITFHTNGFLSNCFTNYY